MARTNPLTKKGSPDRRDAAGRTSSGLIPPDKHFAGEVGRPPLTLLTEGDRSEVRRRAGGSINRGTMALTAADGTCRLVCHKISLGLESPSPTIVGSLEHPRPRYSSARGRNGGEKNVAAIAWASLQRARLLLFSTLRLIERARELAIMRDARSLLRGAARVGFVRASRTRPRRK